MDYEIHRKRIRDLPFSTQWRAALVRLPRFTPLAALRITSPEGPYPFIVHLPSRSGEHKIPAYVFLPSAPKNPAAVPVHLDFHGGGFIMGGAVEQGPFCAKLSRERQIVTLCVDYCQGPRYEFPAALQDAEDVLSAVIDEESEAGRTLREGIDKKQLPSRHILRHASDRSATNINLDINTLSISGFSSGGNVALNLAISIEKSSKVDAWPCRFPAGALPIPLILFYPSFDQHLLPHERPLAPNVPKPGRFGISLSTKLYPTYLPENVRSHPRANPGLVSVDAIHDRVRIFLVLAEIDTLAVQSDEWVKKMKEAGKADRLVVYKGQGMEHGWCNIPEKFISKEARRQKMEVYDRMMRFWDETIAVDEMKDGQTDRQRDRPP